VVKQKRRGLLDLYRDAHARGAGAARARPGDIKL